MTNHIAVLIACHNRKTSTLKCLEALFSQNKASAGFEFDVYLVDDGSTDGTSTAVAALYPHVNIIQGTGDLFADN